MLCDNFLLLLLAAWLFGVRFHSHAHASSHPDARCSENTPIKFFVQRAKPAARACN